MMTGADPGRPGRSGRCGAGPEQRARRSGDDGSADWWILLVILLVVLAVIAFFLVQSLAEQPARDRAQRGGPDGGRRPRQTLQSDNLSVGTTTRRRPAPRRQGAGHLHRPRGRRQGGEEQPRRTWSSAPAPRAKVTVPPVVGQQLNAAAELLTNAGLSFKTTYVTSTKPPGTVLTQDPAGGTIGQVDHGGQADGVQQPSPRQGAQRGRLHPDQRPAAPSPGNSLTRRDPDQRLFTDRWPTGNIASTDPGRRDPGADRHAGQPGRLLRSLLGHRARRDPARPRRRGQRHHRRSPGLTPSFTPGRTARRAAGTPGTVQSQSPSPGDGLEPALPADGHHDRLPATGHDHHDHHGADRLAVGSTTTTTATTAPDRRVAALVAEPPGAAWRQTQGTGVPASWARKLPSSAGPETVRTDSGWNWTPSIGQLAVAQAHDHAVG